MVVSKVSLVCLTSGCSTQLALRAMWVWHTAEMLGGGGGGGGGQKNRKDEESITSCFVKQVELRYIIGERFCYHNSIASYPGSWWGGPTVGLFGKSLESSEDFSMRCQCLVSNLLRRYVGKCGEYVVVKVRRSPASRVGSGYETSHTIG